MALINLNIKTFKKDLGGIADRLVDRAIGRVESKLENAVEGVVGKALNKVGLSGQGVANFTSRFNDAFANGKADDFFKTSTAEQNRVTAKESIDNMKSTPDGTGSTGVTETAAQASASISAPAAKPETFFQFPEKLGEYYMMMRFKEYRRPSPQSVATLVPYDTFAFPLPRDLKESFDVNVSEKAQELSGGLADISTAFFRGQGAEATLAQTKAVVYSYAVQQFEGVGDLLGQFAGAVPNPHIQAIFDGVGLRKHSFSWTFAPRNARESIQLKEMINKIKVNSLPAYSNLGTAALQYPPLVDIKLMPTEINELIKFKTCIVSNVSINYAPQGLPSFFEGTRQPTMIQLTIDMMETMIQTANDYDIITGEKSGNTRNDRATELYDKARSFIESRPVIGEAFRSAEEFATSTLNTIRPSDQ